MSNQTFVEHVIATWHVLEAEAPRLGTTSAVKRSSDGTKGVIEIRTPGSLATVEVWEHANCLDTTILREGEGMGVILAAGPCVNRAESTERLRTLRKVLAQASSA
jgi:hypothetical protein